MKPRAFADGIAQATIYNHLLFHYGQCVFLLHVGYRDAHDMPAAELLGLYIREMEERWAELNLKAAVAAARFDLQEMKHECHGASC